MNAAAEADDWEPCRRRSARRRLGARWAAHAAAREPRLLPSIKERVEPVMNAMGQGFREGWGPDRWGMSEENVKWLSKVGIYAPEGATSYSNPFQAMNELLGETIARTGEAFSRGLPAAYRAAQSAAVEAGVNRDIASIPDAFMGSPHPTGRPGAAIAEGQRAASFAEMVKEVASGERVPTVAEVAQARQLGVVGPEPPRMSEANPREAAAAATRSPDDILRGPEPGGEPGATGNPWRDRFEHFVGKLETSEDVKTLIREAATTNDEFTAARAGDVPLAHVEGLAEAAGVAPQLIDHTGVGRLMKNDNEVRIGMQLMLQTTDNVMEAARNARADATPESLIKLQEAIMRRDLAVEQVVGARAEWGRTGRVFQEFMRDVKDQEGLTSFLKDKGRTPTDLQGIADSLGDLDRTQAARVLSDLHQRTPGVFYWTWVNGLISGLLTHTKYVAANALYAASEHGVTTPLAAVIGKAKQAFGAEAERVYFGEALAATYGGIAAVPHSLIATAKSIYSGQRAVLKSEIEVHKDMVARGEKVPHVIDQAVNQVTGRGRPEVFQNSDVWGKLSAGDLKGSMVDALGRTIGAPGDMAMGIHTFFKVLGERAGLEAEAYRAAAKEGLSPAEGDFWRRRSELSENPTIAMRERAIAGPTRARSCRSSARTARRGSA
jgi:hypothetical protein